MALGSIFWEKSYISKGTNEDIMTVFDHELNSRWGRNNAKCREIWLNIYW